MKNWKKKKKIVHLKVKFFYLMHFDSSEPIFLTKKT